MTGLNDGSFLPNMQQTLAYDPLNRLSSVSSPANTESWQYDADGNAISRTLNGTTSQLYPSASSNRLDRITTGGNTVSYGYDAMGNQISSTGGPGLNYDPFNRMNLATAALSTSYYVNPEGQRLRKSNTGNTTYFAPDAGGTLAADDSNGVWSDYVWLNGRPIALIRGGVTYAIHDDHLGRPQAVTRPDKYTVWLTENYPYRRRVMTDLIGGLNLGYPGQYQDSETGYWNNGARDYDQGTERYIESDPIGLLGGINTYAYVGNNPISNVDPLGMEGYGSWTYSVGAGTCPDSGAAGLLATIIVTEIIGLGPEDPAADAAVVAEIADAGSGVTVLGSYPEYIETAQQVGANYFSVPAEEWAQMSAADQWGANKAFLDEAIGRGDSFQFSNEFAPAGSSYERELQYLQQRGVFTAAPPGG